MNWPNEEMKAIWETIRPAVNAALDDGHYLADTPEQRRRDAEADELAAELDD